ncbi:MAG TPA: ATP-binding protein [Methylomirabilota bacterium]
MSARYLSCVGRSLVRWLQTRPGRYTLAVAAPTLAVLLMLPLRSPAVESPPFVAAILLVAWLAGFGPAVVATGLSALAIDYVFLSPTYGFDGIYTEWPWFLVFVAVSLIIAKLAADYRRAEEARHLLLRREQQSRAEAERARTEADAANRAKDEFLAVLSHELRTPLTAMLGWARMLRAGRLAPDQVHHAVGVIERNIRFQAQLVNDLLDVSRITSGKLHLDFAPVDLVATIDVVLESTRPMANAKGIAVSRELGAAVVFVRGDRGRLHQIVANVVSNAIKFTPPGGRIDVRLDRTARAARVVVRDTGTGIDPALMPNIFDRFKQGDSSTTRSHGGLGLGLAIVRHLVELHGGSVEATSPGPGQGSTFTIMLPISADVSVSAEWRSREVGVEPQRLPALDGLRVLVVDDEPDTRDLLATVLAACHADVSAVPTAGDAARAFERRRLDVLVSDVMMPGADGYDLVRRLRAWEAEHGGHVPAIAVTGRGGSEERDRALAAGFDAYLPKPVDPEDLAHTVASVIDRRGR